MKRLFYFVLIAGLIAVAYWAGWRRGSQPKAAATPVETRKVLYYVDPMNPAHTSDRPGKAPCGMDMEPVYADTLLGMASDAALAALPAGTIRVSPEKQQLIGVRIAPAEKAALRHNLRLLGKVTTDETRLYRINATVDGWITKTLPISAGTPVKKDETLAAFYSSEFLAAGQALLFALNSRDRVQAAGMEGAAASNRVAQFDINLQQYKDSLRNLGMGDLQVEEMIRTRKFMQNINIVSPADGFVRVRNLSEGQRFEKGTELFQIVDLSRVWILADVFEKEARLLAPELQARVSLPEQNKSFTATLARTLPQFDSTSRTLKLRFEVENPEFVLKPDMFVDVELPVSLPETLVVPAEAVLDAGVRKTVFVERGHGYFEPRVVQTGAQLGNQVEIVQGLTPGERIAVSGNFLLDSESRMRLAAAGVHGTPARDPVCGKDVDEAKARAAKRTREHVGKVYFFCDDGCKREFELNPAKYVGGAKAPPNLPPAIQATAIDPVCGMQVTETKARAANRFRDYEGKTFYFCNDSCQQEFDANPKQFVKQTSAK